MATFKDRIAIEQAENERARSQALATAATAQAMQPPPAATQSAGGSASSPAAPSGVYNPTPDVSGVGGALGDAWRWITE